MEEVVAKVFHVSFLFLLGLFVGHVITMLAAMTPLGQ